MTAEIVIMNSGAVALAADSAMTLIDGKKKLQTYFSGNKLFCLSYNSPVGIMFYEGSSIHSLPWETVIKIYRKKLGAKVFSHLEEYADDFLNFLREEQSFLFPEKIQLEYFTESVRLSIREIENKIKIEWGKDNPKNVARPPTKKFFNNCVDDLFQKNFGTAEWFDQEATKKFLPLISEQLNASEPALCEFLYRTNIAKFVHLVFRQVIKNRHFGYTGIIFAGFGERDLFPAVCSFELCGFYLGQLKVEKRTSHKIQHGNEVKIIPFAQTDMVETFLNGISPSMDQVIRMTFLDRIIKIPMETIDEIADLTPEQKNKWKNEFLEKSQGAAVSMMEVMSQHISNTFTNPVVNGMRHLAKDELASVAEAMLNLAALQKKVSPGDDSVGGPIDSAVISKGDGFVWINRKHYFKPELNSHFFTKYSVISDRISKEIAVDKETDNEKANA